MANNCILEHNLGSARSKEGLYKYCMPRKYCNFRPSIYGRDVLSGTKHISNPSLSQSIFQRASSVIHLKHWSARYDAQIDLRNPKTCGVFLVAPSLSKNLDSGTVTRSKHRFTRSLIWCIASLKNYHPVALLSLPFSLSLSLSLFVSLSLSLCLCLMNFLLSLESL